MATTRKRITRARKKDSLSEGLAKLLLFGRVSRDTPEWQIYLSRHFDQGKKIAEIWKQHEQELMAQWKNEGYKGLPWVIEYLKNKGKLEILE